jgi:hypothetical protein
MKRLTQSQIQNLIFLGVVMLVAASVVVYLLLKGEPTTALEDEPDTRAGETAAPAKERFEAAPAAVVWTRLKGDTRFVLTKLSDAEYEIALADRQDGIAATLHLGESDGRVVSMLWCFSLPKAPEAEPKNEIEKRLMEHYEAQMRGAGDCIQTILSASFEACDLNGALLEPTRRVWQDGALETLAGGKDYKDTAGACTFSAYVSDGPSGAALVLALLFN